MTEFSDSYQPPNEDKSTAVAKSNKRRTIMTDALMVALNREVDGIVDDDGRPTKKLNQIATKLVDKAVEGDTQAIKEVFDRTEGKAAQALELTGADGGAIEHKWTVQIVDAKHTDT